jgi:acyl-CoA thioester hydrolase
MPGEFRMTHRVEFVDTDLAGIMHFSNFFRLMERTEHAFLRTMGGSVHMQTPDGIIGWPRVAASCEYRQPLRFEDEVEIVLTVREKKARSVTYDFSFQKDGMEVAKGSMTAVCVAIDKAAGTMKAVTIPPELSAQIVPAAPTR